MQLSIGELITYAVIIIFTLAAIFIAPERFERPKNHDKKEPDD